MNRRRFFLLPLLLLILPISGCSKSEPAALVPADYSGWSSTTDIELNYPIPGHENNYRRIFINDTGKNSPFSAAEGSSSGTGKTYDYPDGTVIIKEVYDGFDYQEGSRPKMLTVMVKDRGNQDARGGWLWIVKDPVSGSENILTQEFCFTCHENANEKHPYGDGNPDEEFRDYVFFPADQGR